MVLEMLKMEGQEKSKKRARLVVVVASDKNVANVLDTPITRFATYVDINR